MKKIARMEKPTLPDVIQKNVTSPGSVKSDTKPSAQTTSSQGATSNVSNEGASNPEVIKMQSAMEELSNKVRNSNLPVNMPQELIDSLKKIGEQLKGQAKFTDGKWGPITDGALHDIYNFANSLVDLIKKFGTEPQLYDQKDAAGLNSMLSEYKVEGNHITLSQQDQSKVADAITDHITSIAKLYDYLLTKVPGSINQSTNQSNNGSYLNAQEQKLLQENTQIVITYQNKQLSMPVSVLTSISNYNNFIASQNLDDKAKNEILDLIIAQAGK